jgi:flagellar assembly protein FliH
MKAVKFTFDTHFGNPHSGAGRSTQAPLRLRRSYSPEEIEALQETARNEGRSESQMQMQAAIAATVSQIAGALSHAIRHMDEEVETIRAEAAQFAFSAAKQLAGAALKTAPQEEIAEALRHALHYAVGEHRILVAVAPSLLPGIEERLTEVAAREGFEGRIQIAADPMLSGADCRLEWRGGGMERAAQHIEKALADLIARRFPPDNQTLMRE